MWIITRSDNVQNVNSSWITLSIYSQTHQVHQIKMIGWVGDGMSFFKCCIVNAICRPNRRFHNDTVKPEFYDRDRKQSKPSRVYFILVSFKRTNAPNDISIDTR